MLRSEEYKVTAMAAVLATLTATLAVWGASPAEAAFPGANGLILFESNRTTGTGVNNPEGDREIFTMNANGTGLTQLTQNTANDLEAAWSPNGQQIVFRSMRDGGNSEIYKMDADGSDPVRLTNYGGMDFEPTWSPSGTKIAFASRRGTGIGNTDIYVMSATDANNDGNGDNLLRLTKHAASDYDPNWSPNGTKIAFVSERDPFVDSVEIYTMKPRPEGKRNRPKNLTKSPTGLDYSPNWSPDGTRIVFVSRRGHSSTSEVGTDTEIYSMNADGTDLTPLTENQSYDDSPVWSPDGSKIAFARFSETGNEHDLYVMGWDGSSPNNITQNPANDTAPDWQPLVP